MTRTTIVIPCYNEADRLDLSRFLDFANRSNHLQLLFVNDGSTDDTHKLLEHMQLAAPAKISVLDQPVNGGKAEAVRAGMLQASRDNSGEEHYIGYWDADLATPLDAIEEFERVLDQNDHLSLVMGSRIKLLGRKIDRKGSRHLIGRAFATVASTMLGLGVYDTQCGAKLFRVSSPIQALFEKPFRSKWIFDVEILARMIQLGRARLLPPIEESVAELPLQSWLDVDGSKLKGRDFLKAAFELLRIYQTYRSRRASYDWMPDAIIPAAHLFERREAKTGSKEVAGSDRRAA